MKSNRELVSETGWLAENDWFLRLDLLLSHDESQLSALQFSQSHRMFIHFMGSMNEKVCILCKMWISYIRSLQLQSPCIFYRASNHTDIDPMSLKDDIERLFEAEEYDENIRHLMAPYANIFKRPNLIQELKTYINAVTTPLSPTSHTPPEPSTPTSAHPHRHALPSTTLDSPTLPLTPKDPTPPGTPLMYDPEIHPEHDLAIREANAFCKHEQDGGRWEQFKHDYPSLSKKLEQLQQQFLDHIGPQTP